MCLCVGGDGTQGTDVPSIFLSERHKPPLADSCDPCPQIPHYEASHSQLVDPPCRCHKQGQLEEGVGREGEGVREGKRQKG